jgi:hypothetical protein
MRRMAYGQRVWAQVSAAIIRTVADVEDRRMLCWRVCITAALLLDVWSVALGQTADPVYDASSVPRVTTQPPNSATDHLKNGPHVKVRPIDPLAEEARRQSGIDQEQARDLLLNGGFNGISDLRAQPNSVWVWQADGLKDGRPVRVGIDYRGNILVLSPNAGAPCASPGIGAGVGALGVGPSLSEATSCGRR